MNQNQKMKKIISDLLYYVDIGHISIEQDINGNYKPIIISYICENPECHRVNRNMKINFDFIHTYKSDMFPVTKYCKYCGAAHKLMLRSYSIEVGGY